MVNYFTENQKKHHILKQRSTCVPNFIKIGSAIKARKANRITYEFIILLNYEGMDSELKFVG